MAAKHVIFLDKRFDKRCYRMMENYILRASKLHDANLECIDIISSEKAHKEGNEIIKNLKEKKLLEKIKISRYEFIKEVNGLYHDRFALLDDEIWHFGSTVGGIYPGITAFSGGWQDYNNSFSNLLHMIIKMCNEVQENV